MAKLGLLASIATIVTALGFATLSSAEDAPPCKRKEFKTELARDACAKGGQKAAKAAMDGFMKEAKKQKGTVVKTCQNPCHKSLAPNYELKDIAVAEFEKAKKLIEDKKKK
jgi:hypothetical protein